MPSIQNIIELENYDGPVEDLALRVGPPSGPIEPTAATFTSLGAKKWLVEAEGPFEGRILVEVWDAESDAVLTAYLADPPTAQVEVDTEAIAEAVVETDALRHLFASVGPAIRLPGWTSEAGHWEYFLSLETGQTVFRSRRLLPGGSRQVEPFTGTPESGGL